jgi:sirohydrochlorin cobaltochelatase
VTAGKVVILVGHGGIAAGTPPGWIAELKELEKQRRRAGAAEMSPREAELDEQIRTFPRTRESDPYRAGLEAIAAELAPRLPGKRLVVAYNEFCAPSLEHAIEIAVAEGATQIEVISTMFTPGGSHSSQEIPYIIAQYQGRHPTVAFRYVWPYDLAQVAELLAKHIEGSHPLG